MCTPISMHAIMHPSATRTGTRAGRARGGTRRPRGVLSGDAHVSRDATIVHAIVARILQFSRILRSYFRIKIDLQDAIGILFCTFYFRVPGGSCRPASLPCPLAPAGCGRWCSLRGAISITDHAAASTVRAHHFPFAPWGGLFSLCALHGRLRRLSGAKSFLPTSILRTMGTSSSFFSWSLC